MRWGVALHHPTGAMPPGALAGLQQAINLMPLWGAGEVRGPGRAGAMADREQKSEEWEGLRASSGNP